jgi:hypothetical protein
MTRRPANHPRVSTASSASVDVVHALRDLAAFIESYAFSAASEARLQDGLSELFQRRGVPVAREVALAPRDRIDFLTTDTALGIEVKIGGSLADLTRQLNRYAQSPRVAGLLAVVTLPRLTALPDTLLGKPVRGVLLVGSLF